MPSYRRVLPETGKKDKTLRMLMRAEIAKKRIRELIKGASKKSEKSAIIVRVLHEMKLHDLPRGETLKIAREHGIPKYHKYIVNGLRIAKALGKTPTNLKKFKKGVNDAGLGHLSEVTKLDIASKAFGIKEASSKAWKSGKKDYAEKIKKALGKTPTNLKEFKKGVNDAGLGHLSEVTKLDIARKAFGIKKRERTVWGHLVNRGKSLYASWGHLVNRGKSLYASIYGSTSAWEDVHKLLKSKNPHDIALGLIKYVGRTGDPVAFLTTLKYYELHKKLSEKEIMALAREFKLDPNNSELKMEIKTLVNQGRLPLWLITDTEKEQEILRKTVLLAAHDLKNINHPQRNEPLKRVLNNEEILSLIAYHFHRVMNAGTPARMRIAKSIFDSYAINIIPKCHLGLDRKTIKDTLNWIKQVKHKTL